MPRGYLSVQRRRKHILVSSCLVGVVLACSLLLTGSLRGDSANLPRRLLDLPSDYDLNLQDHGRHIMKKGRVIQDDVDADDVDDAGANLDQVSVVRKMVDIQDNNGNHGNGVNSMDTANNNNNGRAPERRVRQAPANPRRPGPASLDDVGGDNMPLKRVINAKGDMMMKMMIDDNKQADDVKETKRMERPLPAYDNGYHFEADARNVVIEDDSDDDDDDEDGEDEEEYYGEDEDPPNPLFKPGDFDKLSKNATSKPAFHYENIDHNNNVKNNNNLKEESYRDYPVNSRGRLQMVDKDPLLNTARHKSFSNKGSPDHRSRGRGHLPLQGGAAPQPCISIHNCPNGHLQKPDPPMPQGQGQGQGQHLKHDRILLDSQPQRAVAKDAEAVYYHSQLDRISATNDLSVHKNKKSVAKEPPLVSPSAASRRAAAVLQQESYLQKIETQIPIQDGLGLQSLVDSKPATQLQMPELPWQPGEVRSEKGIPLVVDKIYWSKEVEDLVPSGITDEGFQHFLFKLSSQPVKEMHPPLWNRCGRPKNQYIVLGDGTPLCARYRHPHDKLVQGEVLSYYLSRLLGLDNIPVVVLSQVNSSAPQWRGQNLTRAEWEEGRMVALIQWQEGLDSQRSRVKMPAVILEAYEKGRPFTIGARNLPSLTANQLSDLLQWSDMILFDYLTGHYDRVASMQDGADREKKPSIMHENIRNLRKVWQTGKLWLIDNESGLLDAYELMFHGHTAAGSKFQEFHRQMLQTSCVFHRKTVAKIEELARLNKPHEILEHYVLAQEPLYRKLQWSSMAYDLFVKHFHKRLKEVLEWVEKCEKS